MPGHCHLEAGDDHHGCSHDHGEEREGHFQRRDPSAFGVSLNRHIDVNKVLAWNVQESNSQVAAMLNPEAIKTIPPPAVVRSDADEELLLFVPFSEYVRIRGIGIIGGGEGFNPSRVKLYVNRSDVDGFDSVRRLEVADTIELAPSTTDDEVLYAVNAVRFMSCGSVTLYIDQNYGGDETHVRGIAFYGVSNREPVNRPVATNVVYELRPNPADHPAAEDDRLKFQIVQ